MTRAISAVVLSIIIASAITAYTVRKSTKRPAAIFWCFTGDINIDGPCRYIRAERRV